jgi:hypothetical protein
MSKIIKNKVKNDEHKRITTRTINQSKNEDNYYTIKPLVSEEIIKSFLEEYYNNLELLKECSLAGISYGCILEEVSENLLNIKFNCLSNHSDVSKVIGRNVYIKSIFSPFFKCSYIINTDVNNKNGFLLINESENTKTILNFYTYYLYSNEHLLKYRKKTLRKIIGILTNDIHKLHKADEVVLKRIKSELPFNLYEGVSFKKFEDNSSKELHVKIKEIFQDSPVLTIFKNGRIKKYLKNYRIISKFYIKEFKPQLGIIYKNGLAVINLVFDDKNKEIYPVNARLIYFPRNFEINTYPVIVNSYFKGKKYLRVYPERLIEVNFKNYRHGTNKIAVLFGHDHYLPMENKEYRYFQKFVVPFIPYVPLRGLKG